MGITTQTMLVVLRMASVSWCYKDGIMPQNTLTERQFKYRVVDLPSPLELLSYSITHMSASVGVFFEYRDYKCHIE